MIQELKNDLLRDELFRAVDRRKKKRQIGRVIAVILPLVAAAGFLRPREEITELVLVPREVGEPVESPEASFTTLNSEEELLSHLAHLGPIMVTRGDGSQVLYLTNEKVGKGGDSPGMQ